MSSRALASLDAAFGRSEIVDSLPQWCAAHRTPCDDIGGSTGFSPYPKPEALIGALPADNDFSRQVGRFRRHYATIPHGGVVTNEGFVLLDRRHFLAEPAWAAENIRNHPIARQLWRRPAKRIHGDGFSLLLYWGTNYYHWLIDVLPRLHNVLGRLPTGCPIVVPEKMPAWMWRTLDLLGVPRERCLPWTGWNPFIFDRFHYASPVAMTGDQESHSLTWLRHTVLHGFPEYGAATTPGRRIYLSRRGGRCREMLNEADLEPVIRARGFELIDPGKLSFDEQVRLFAEASVIVGPHGAAFTNMLWSRPGSVVCEIFEPSAIRRCYWSMAHTLGHRYHCAVAESVPGPIEPNMRLAPEALDHILRTVSSC